MKVVILAGGWKSSIHDEYEGIPKPMVEIGGKPLLWHIMKQYSQYGYKDFIICAGYKSKLIKEYFMNYYIYESDITIDLQNNHIEIHKQATEDWNVSVIDTGLYTTVSERIMQIKELIGNDDFFIHYGDCLSDINMNELEKFHRKEEKIATFTVAKPIGRNKIFSLTSDGQVKNKEASDSWVNACILLCKPEVISYLKIEESYLEDGLLERLQEKNSAAIYRHRGFWNMIETVRDKQKIEQRLRNQNINS